LPAQTHVPSLAIEPRKPHSLHLTSIDLPDVGPHDVLTRVLEIGVCGTDRELIEGRFGVGPNGSSELVIGHEVFGVVESVGADVTAVKPGDLISATARRGCSCAACQAGESDFCSAHGYKERGINGLHGYFTERFVEHESQLVVIPDALRGIGVLVEPCSVAEKAWRVANGVQSRIRSWNPTTAVVYGAGPIGLLATLVLRVNGLDVSTIDIKPEPNRNAEIVRGCGAVYLEAGKSETGSLKRDLPNVDVIVECTGSSAPLVDAMRLLGNNGVLVLLSGTGGTAERSFPADKIYREFVSGNKVMVGSVNSSLADFRAAVADLGRFELAWPGLATKLITRRIQSFEEAKGLPGLMQGQVKAIIDLDH
jgi:threonine dehydrogenase-like Zn-dependent dehydrogenase